ncbi:BZ3500_MvSof-1268-A1-R1_Chr1-3g01952 [Microbotryum saponariae]|uniref:BZ3500_MvSof-1268-A1-R1_Chr1-3g01952 protein n=1 Tax=Microbotryum saponariae TaxID=289078 RepID=A0A2X0KFI8_9BASI|nr:BZ3500_MvSof-1268-A1-R1_Chr1-3g01952 [Microbotryum saponariae]SCZ94995.1 BZ3501_MvSof-1269-A2-R1_Chr1-3g01554 [Microbotryum saponariae]
MSGIYPEPQYVLSEPATAILSDTRQTSLTPAALAIINYTLDELLQLWVHAALTQSPSTPTTSITSGAPPTSAPSRSGPSPLGPSDAFTTERLKAGVIRVLGPLGKNSVLEAELAVRELLRMSAPSLRADPALRRAQPTITSSATSRDAVSAQQIVTQADTIFRALRDWLMIISGLGGESEGTNICQYRALCDTDSCWIPAACPNGGPTKLGNHLRALSPSPPPPENNSPHLTFMLVLYAERCLSHVAEHLIRAVGQVNQRGLSEAVDLRDVELAFAEDDLIWSWLRGMRIRGHLEAEVAASKSIDSPTNLSRNPKLTSSPKLGRPSSLHRSSYDSKIGSISSVKGDGLPSPTLAVDSTLDDFESLLQDNRTMKLSLTPDRLRTMERLGDSGRNQLNGSGVDASGESALSRVSINSTATPIPVKRLQARSPRPPDELEVLQEDPLIDILNSPPPWSRQSSNDNNPTGAGSGSVPMRVQDSQSSNASSDIEPVVIEGPNARMRGIRAKDEREDLLSERQVNNDLVDFFSAPPPRPSDTQSIASAAPSYATNAPSASPATVTNRIGDAPPSPSPVKKRGGFRTLFSKSKVAASNSEESLSTTRTSTDASASSSPNSKNQSFQSRNAKPSAEMVSAAALLATGFSETTVRQVAQPVQRLSSLDRQASAGYSGSEMASATTSAVSQAQMQRNRSESTEPPTRPPPRLPPGLSEEPGSYQTIVPSRETASSLRSRGSISSPQVVDGTTSQTSRSRAPSHDATSATDSMAGEHLSVTRGISNTADGVLLGAASAGTAGLALARPEKSRSWEPTAGTVATQTDRISTTDASPSPVTYHDDADPWKRDDLVDLRRRMAAASTKDEALELFDQQFGTGNAATVEPAALVTNGKVSNGLSGLVGAAVMAPLAAVAAAGATLFGTNHDSTSKVEPAESSPAPDAGELHLTPDQAQYDERVQAAIFDYFLSGGQPAYEPNPQHDQKAGVGAEAEDSESEASEEVDPAPPIGGQSTEIEGLVEKHRKTGGFEPPVEPSQAGLIV